MKKYELMFIVKPDLDEASIKNVGNEMKTLVESNGAKVVDYKEMGQKELAYEIKGYKNGYYFLIVIESENEKAVDEFARVALINENIIRNLVVKVSE